ncbi:MAG: lysophospholipase [Rhodospirillaceae bacterium]|jgi:outer membrane protein OmpA-like peptidoglycan-associated protein|nr:lysophospholipase [Rhodospirillaceae bacterium]|tara:strand:- start:7215 stop:8207 length:993 start_codon:yes stop_codon:yes gene_type:complete
MKTLPGPFLASARRLMMVAVLAAASLSFGGNAAKAQGGVDLSTDNVTVDLSVIEDSGGSPAAAMPYMVRPPGTGVRSGLLVPGRKSPVSRLHVAVPKSPRIKLKPPSAKGKKAAKRVARKKPKPKKPAMPAVAAAKPPAPLTARVARPPEPAKPARKMAVAKPTPPTPPQVKKPVVKKPVPPLPVKAPEKAAEPKPAPKPKPVAKAKPKPVAKEQAALPPAKETIKTGRVLQVAFGVTASKLPPEAKNGLKDLAEKLKDKKNLRLQLLAYAGGKALSPSKARRMSLSRALSVRSFLIENGIRSTRIDVRALGSKTSEKPLNRVDVNIVER